VCYFSLYVVLENGGKMKTRFRWIQIPLSLGICFWILILPAYQNLDISDDAHSLLFTLTFEEAHQDLFSDPVDKKGECLTSDNLSFNSSSEVHSSNTFLPCPYQSLSPDGEPFFLRC
jgi:hypothetical protein